MPEVCLGRLITGVHLRIRSRRVTAGDRRRRCLWSVVDRNRELRVRVVK